VQPGSPLLDRFFAENSSEAARFGAFSIRRLRGGYW
jgi:hypothetical protein